MSGPEHAAGRNDVAVRSVGSRWYIAVSLVPDKAKPGSTEWQYRAASTAEENTIGRLNAEWLAELAADVPKRELCRACRAKSVPGHCRS